MNLQGDEPLMNVADIQKLHTQMVKTKFELGTLASNITDQESYDNLNVVKVVTKESLDNSQFPEAINFTRKLNDRPKNIYKHLGIYCYKLKNREKFVSFNQYVNDIKYKWEQLRALDSEIKMNDACAKASPVGVDTKEEFRAIKKIM